MQRIHKAVWAAAVILLLMMPAASHAAHLQPAAADGEPQGTSVYMWSDAERACFAVTVCGAPEEAEVSVTVWPQGRTEEAAEYQTRRAGSVHVAEVDTQAFDDAGGQYCAAAYMLDTCGERSWAGTAKTVVRPSGGCIAVCAEDAQQNAFCLTLLDAALPDHSTVVFSVFSASGDIVLRRPAHRDKDGRPAVRINASALGRPGMYSVRAHCTVAGLDELVPVGDGSINVAGLVSSRTSFGLSPDGAQGAFAVQARISARSAVKSAAVDIWYADRPEEVRTYALTRNGSEWTASGNISSFDRSMGVYCARVYAVLENGVTAEAGRPKADLRPSNYMWTERDDSGITVHVQNVASTVRTVEMDAWSRTGGADDLVQYTASRVSPSSWQGRIEYRKHRDSGVFQLNLLVDGSLCGRTFAFVPAEDLPAEEPLRGVWVPSIWNLDFPRTMGNASRQMDEFRAIVQNCRDWGLNALFVQVRPHCDALYESDLNPWSDTLTGRWGADPGYDPLAFMISTAHDAGLELHAWLNPYRVCQSSQRALLDAKSVAAVHPEWVLEYDGALYLDPGSEGVRRHITDTVLEILDHYEVDGIHFDDYFYPYSYPLPDGELKEGAVGNERRENVTMLVRQVADAVHQHPRRVKFGISPFGIWKNQSSDPRGSRTTGAESYYSNYCDSAAWVREGMLDYICPQLYWPTHHEEADYAELVRWWTETVRGTGTDLVIGQGLYNEDVAREIEQELAINAESDQLTGSIFYRYGDIEADPQLAQRLHTWYSSLQQLPS